jgi:hypothetical protein
MRLKKCGELEGTEEEVDWLFVGNLTTLPQLRMLCSFEC